MSEENTGSVDSGAQVESEALDSESAQEVVVPTPAQKKMIKQLKLKFNGKDITEEPPQGRSKLCEGWGEIPLPYSIMCRIIVLF